MKEFKAQCLSLIDDVYDRDEEIMIVKNGKMMAKLVRYKPDEIFGFMRGKGRIIGDLVEPITAPDEWSDDIFPSTPKRKKR